MFLLLSSCGVGHQKNEKRTVFRYNESAGISSLDPAFARDQATTWICNQLYNGLVQLDENLHVSPCMSDQWMILDSGTTFVFHLRNDVFFHASEVFPEGKGRKVTAADFVYSFNRLRDGKTASPGAWVLAKVVSGDSGILAPDDTTLIIHLSEPFPPFLSMLSMQYCSVIPHEAIARYGKDFRSNPVGTGPFMFKFWKEGAKLVLVKNPAYFETENGNQLPYLDAVSVSFIIDKMTVFLEFVQGGFDFLSGIDASYKDELLTRTGQLNPKYKGKIAIAGQPYLNTEYLGFMLDSLKDPLKNNPLRIMKIRQAINYGFDRDKMMTYLRNNIGTPGTSGFVPPFMPGFAEQPSEGYNYQPDKARQLLREAGFPNGKGLPPITLNTNSSYLDLCKYIQSQLTDLGIQLRIEVTPPATLREMMAQSKVQFFRGSWIADYPDAENYLSLFYSPNHSPGGPNYTHYSSPEFDRLYEMAGKTDSDSMRFAYYRMMDSLVIDEAAVVVLYYDQVLRFMQSNIEGLGSNAMNMLSLKKVKKSELPKE
ncbi:MAG: ABC transporter substrate-binding protein [Bacteroidetes bacterium]|nr:ABC transporter substrate-binding protein [Bacteroidota bacterium]